MCISLSKPYISVADNAWHCYKNQKFMATFSQFQQPLENPVHWGSSRRLVENGELPRRLFLLSVVYGRTWQTHALLLSSVITCAMYSVWLCVTSDCIFPHAFLCAPKLPSWSCGIRRRTSRVHSGSLLCISNASSSFFSSYFTELFFSNLAGALDTG